MSLMASSISRFSESENFVNCSNLQISGLARIFHLPVACSTPLRTVCWATLGRKEVFSAVTNPPRVAQRRPRHLTERLTSLAPSYLQSEFTDRGYEPRGPWHPSRG